MFCVIFHLDEEGEVLEEKKEFVRVFLMMHQWFIADDELAHKFIDLYPSYKSTETALYLLISCFVLYIFFM